MVYKEIIARKNQEIKELKKEIQRLTEKNKELENKKKVEEDIT